MEEGCTRLGIIPFGILRGMRHGLIGLHKALNVSARIFTPVADLTVKGAKPIPTWLGTGVKAN